MSLPPSQPFPQKASQPSLQKNSQPSSQKAKTCLSTQSLLTFIVALLALNAIGFLFLSIQFSLKQPVVVVSLSSVDSKLDAISAKLSLFQAQVQKIDARTEEASSTPAEPQGGEVMVP